MKLNVGGGFQKMDGYMNVDIHQTGITDIVHDIEKKLPFENETVDEIYSSHSLEHCSMNAVPEMLKDWNRVLRLDGRIHIIVPELEGCMRNFLNASEEERWGYRIEYIFGGQDHQVGQQSHKTGFTKARLQKLVENAGFQIDTLSIVANSCNDCLHLTGHKIKNI